MNNFKCLFLFVFILVIGFGCSSDNTDDDETEENLKFFVRAEVSGNLWLADSVSRSGISTSDNFQSYALMAQDKNFAINITISQSGTFEEGKVATGTYSGTKLFFEIIHLYEPYAIQAYFQGNRSTSENKVEIIHSDGKRISGNFSGKFFKGDRNYPPYIDENSPDVIHITKGEFRNMPLDLYPSFP